MVGPTLKKERGRDLPFHKLWDLLYYREKVDKHDTRFFKVGNMRVIKLIKS